MSDDIPVRTEVLVLPGDEPSEKKIGFVVHEYNGVELHPLTEDGHVDSSKTFKKDELQVGMTVACASLFGGYNVIEIKKDKHGELYGENGVFWAILEFTTDDRACWVSTGGGNLSAIKKLTADRP